MLAIMLKVTQIKKISVQNRKATFYNVMNSDNMHVLSDVLSSDTHVLSNRLCRKIVPDLDQRALSSSKSGTCFIPRPRISLTIHCLSDALQQLSPLQFEELFLNT